MSSPDTDATGLSTRAARPSADFRPLNWVMLVAGALLTAIGVGVATLGVAVMIADASQRDGQYAYTDTEELRSTGNAVTAGPISLDLGGTRTVGGIDLDDMVSFRIRATSIVPGQQVFLGVGPAGDVADYLRGVPRSEAGQRPWEPGGADERGAGSDRESGRQSPLEDIPGSRSPGPPADEVFWTQSVTGTGQQTMTVDLRSGDWILVVMNADGSPPVWVDLQVGVHTELLDFASPGLLIAGLACLIVGVPLMLLGAAGLGREIDEGDASGQRDVPGEGGGASASGAGAIATGAHRDGDRLDPLRLTGHLDAGVSRGLWLVKWLLAIPHYIVLSLLWFAVVVVTIVSGFAVLFTGRYPRPWFMFSSGVLRWNWRVGFYAYAALGTDRYPPFTLARTDYPADLEIVYPRRLSRGLVLVKWWLLVFPHLLIVGIFTGGAAAAANDASTGSGFSVSFSLAGLIVVIAAIALLFTGRYPRGLFDLLVGLNRWSYRVGSYVLLLRDQYPPFRLDQGPEEQPGTAPAGQQALTR